MEFGKFLGKLNIFQREGSSPKPKSELEQLRQEVSSLWSRMGYIPESPENYLQTGQSQTQRYLEVLKRMGEIKNGSSQ